ncbi:hypothetical protein ABK514_000701 [Escherichia coli]
MSNIDTRADSVSRIIADLKLKHGSGDTYAPIMRWDELLALLDELEAKDKRLNEILAPNMLLPAIDDMDEDNLRHVIKTVCENYSLLHAKWEAAEKRIAELSQKADIYDMLRQDYELQGSLVDFVDWQAKRIAEQRETLLTARSHVMKCARMGDAHANGVLQAIDRAAAGKGE